MSPATAATTATEDRFRVILTGPVVPTLMRLSLPVLAVICAQVFVSVLEAFWVSRLGTAAVAGVALVLPVFVLMGTMSNGGIGGGVSSAVSRALGRGDRSAAEVLLVHAIALAIGFGTLFTAGALLFGHLLYAALGGEGPALAAALQFSDWSFAASIPVWLVNLIAAAMRGAGEVRLPAKVSLAGAAILVPLSPLLIFGCGPLPGLGLAGAAIAVAIFYAGALLVYMRYLLGGRGVLALHRTPLAAGPFRAILGVGLISAIGTLVASLTVIAITGAVGRSGSAALAGFGLASRLDSLLVPLLFGLGTGVVTMAGAATGAGMHGRAMHVAWTGAAFAFAGTEAVGIAAALFPNAWMGIFSTDPAVVTAGAQYLRIAAPFFGALGFGLMLYFANQGRGRMRWPFIAGLSRLAVTAGGGWALALAGFGLPAVFSAAAAGMLLFGIVNAIGLFVSRPGRG